MINQETSFFPFCEDLLVNIIIKLPERDILKCKCVSKEWYKIVSYVCVPLLAAEAPLSGVYFRVAKGAEVPFVSTYCPQDSKDRLHHLVAYCDSVHYVGTASLTPKIVRFWSNSCRPKPQFFVCNPAIRQCVPIPRPPSSIRLSSLYASLAFDPCESVEYRVVILSLTSQPQCMHVFSSQTGEWKTHELEIELPTSAKSFKLIRHSVYLKNIVFRLSMFCKILCFDLISMKARVLDCPSQKSPPTHQSEVKDQPPPGCIGVSNGLLSYVTDDDGYFCVWLLDNPNESFEWTLKYKICCSILWKYMEDITFYGLVVWLRYCGIHPTSDILFLGSNRTILMYHIESDRLEAVRYIGVRSEVHCGYFFPIFLQKNMFVTLKNWCRDITTRIDNYEDIQDPWCYFEQ